MNNYMIKINKKTKIILKENKIIHNSLIKIKKKLFKIVEIIIIIIDNFNKKYLNHKLKIYLFENDI